MNMDIEKMLETLDEDAIREQFEKELAAAKEENLKKFVAKQSKEAQARKMAARNKALDALFEYCDELNVFDGVSKEEKEELRQEFSVQFSEVEEQLKMIAKLNRIAKIPAHKRKNPIRKTEDDILREWIHGLY